MIRHTGQGDDNFLFTFAVISIVGRVRESSRSLHTSPDVFTQTERQVSRDLSLKSSSPRASKSHHRQAGTTRTDRTCTYPARSCGHSVAYLLFVPTTSVRFYVVSKHDDLSTPNTPSPRLHPMSILIMICFYTCCSSFVLVLQPIPPSITNSKTVIRFKIQKRANKETLELKILRPSPLCKGSPARKTICEENVLKPTPFPKPYIYITDLRELYTV